MAGHLFKKIKQYHSYFAVILIVAIGGFLRLWRIREYMTFLGDEGRDALIVYNIFSKFDIPFIGPTASVGGFFLGPIYYYFMAPFLFLFRFDPVGPAVMVALVGIVTIWLVYFVGKEFYSQETGFIASSLYAVSPLVIAHSRSSWNPNIVPFFALLLIMSLKKLYGKNNKWWSMVLGASFGIGIQLHYIFFFLLPVIIVYLFLTRKKKFLFQIMTYAFIGFFIFIFPFLGFEVKNKFLNTRLIISYIFTNKEVGYKGGVFSTIQDIVFRLFARLVYYFPPSEQWYLHDNQTLFIWRSIVILTIFASFIIVSYRLIRYRKKEDIILSLWAFFGIGLFSFYHREIYDYYFVIMFPLPFILTGLILSLIKRIPYGIIVVIILTGALLYLNLLGMPFLSPPNRQVEQTEKIARKVFNETNGEPYNFALLSHGNSDHAYRYFLTLWGRPPVIILNPQIDHQRKSVTHQLFVVCEYRDCAPLGSSLWEIAGFGQAEIEKKWDVSVVTIYKLVPYKN